LSEDKLLTGSRPTLEQQATGEPQPLAPAPPAPNDPGQRGVRGGTASV